MELLYIAPIQWDDAALYHPSPVLYITLNFTRFARFLTPARITAIQIATLCSVVAPDPLETAAEASQLAV